MNEKDDVPRTLSDSIPKEAYFIGFISFLAGLGWAVYVSMFALFLFDEYGFTSLDVGFSTLVLALVYVLTNIFMFNYIAKRAGLAWAAMIGMLLLTVGLAGVPVSLIPHLLLLFFKGGLSSIARR